MYYKVRTQWSDNNANENAMSRWHLFFCGPSIRYFSYLWFGLPRSLFSSWSKSKILFAYLNPMFSRYMSGQSIQYYLINVHFLSLHSTVNCRCIFGRWELHVVTSATTKTILCVRVVEIHYLTILHTRILRRDELWM